MLIALPNGTMIPGNLLLSATLRTDLVPVPLSLEFVTQSAPELEKALVKGAELRIGEEMLPVTIIKVQTMRTQIVRDNAALGAIAVVAILSGCVPLIEPARRAVIQSDTSIAAAYRSCGAKVAFSADIPIPKFVCLVGHTPTVEIARGLQEEAAVVMLKKGKVQAIRLADLMSGSTSWQFDPSAMQWIDSPAAEQRLAVSVVSLDDDGVTVNGDPKEGRPVIYLGGLDTRRAKNLERVLMTRAVMIRPLDYRMQAGDMVQAGDRKMVILTAAHRFDTGAMGGATAMVSKLWLAEVSK